MKSNDLDIDNSTIIEECKNGNREAMSLLYTRFAPRMMRVISRYVNDEDSARDVLHDGFIAAYTRLDSLREPERLELWLATIMKNLSLKLLQSQNVASILEEIPETEDKIEIDETLDFETIELLIRQLPKGYQNVFRLAVLENKSHKEISKILGIAPNSSSSQLFHAKLLMRKLIKEYRQSAAILTMLLIVATVGMLIFFKYPSEDNETGNLISFDTSVERIIQKVNTPDINNNSVNAPDFGNQPSVSSAPASSSIIAFSDSSLIASHTISVEEADTVASDAETLAESPAVVEPLIIAETSKGEVDSPRDNELLYAQLQKKHNRRKGWSASIAVNTGTSINLGDFGNHDTVLASPPADDKPDPNPDIDNPTQLMQSRRYPKDILDNLKSQPSKHYLPITIGVTVERRLTSWLGVESGISYTYLRTDFENNSNKTICHWHYLEVPLKVNLYAYDSSRFAVYGSIGGRYAIPVHSKVSYYNYSISGDTGMSFKSPTSWAVGGSIGVSYHLSKRLDLYIEPSLQYHFPHEYKIQNIWNEERWHFSLPIGLRFNW
ncbi:MAG: sigma-70 family RNA polymerase sigma factor [Muribaculaceae bacterium]|nr:sigma-70 family RNA polymerase sigma factor [Muribaculaceae bacterium]